MEIADAMAVVFSFANAAVRFVQENQVTMIMFVASLVPIGFRVLRRGKRAAAA